MRQLLPPEIFSNGFHTLTVHHTDVKAFWQRLNWERLRGKFRFAGLSVEEVEKTDEFQAMDAVCGKLWKRLQGAKWDLCVRIHPQLHSFDAFGYKLVRNLDLVQGFSRVITSQVRGSLRTYAGAYVLRTLVDCADTVTQEDAPSGLLSEAEITAEIVKGFSDHPILRTLIELGYGVRILREGYSLTASWTSMNSPLRIFGEPNGRQVFHVDVCEHKNPLDALLQWVQQEITESCERPAFVPYIYNPPQS